MMRMFKADLFQRAAGRRGLELLMDFKAVQESMEGVSSNRSWT